MALALGRIAEEEVGVNLHLVSKRLNGGQCGLLFTNQAPTDVIEWDKLAFFCVFFPLIHLFYPLDFLMSTVSRISLDRVLWLQRQLSYPLDLFLSSLTLPNLS